jgi:hypothetical protein
VIWDHPEDGRWPFPHLRHGGPAHRFTHIYAHDQGANPQLILIH